MSLHQISESERQRASITRARLARMGVNKIVVPKLTAITLVEKRVQILNPYRHLRAGQKRFPIQGENRPVSEMQPWLTVDEIIRHVAFFYKLNVTDFISERRTANLVRPRQIAMWLSKKMTTKSFPFVGRRLGGRDHTTVLHGVRKIEDLRLRDPELNELLLEFVTALRLTHREKSNAEVLAGLSS